MQKTRKPTPPMPRPAADEDTLLDGAGALVHRCPFCHEGADANTSVVCRDCLTRHHPGCWDEGGGRCSSCQGERRFEPEKLTLGKAIQLLEGHGYPAEQIKDLLAPAVAPKTARPPTTHLRGVVEALLSMALVMAVIMGLAGILFAGILDLDGNKLQAMLAWSFGFSSLVGLSILRSGLKRH